MMSERPSQDIALDEVIAEVRSEARWHGRKLRHALAELEHLEALRDGRYLSACERIEIRDLDDLFAKAHRQDRHRQPERPTFGQESP